MIEALKCLLIILWLPIGLGVTVKWVMPDLDVESDGFGIFIAVPLWPIILLIVFGSWCWKKARS